MKQCRVCGTLSSDDTVFCYICGTKFSNTKPENIIENTDNTCELVNSSQPINANPYQSHQIDANLKMSGVYYFIENGFRYLLKFSDNGDVQGTSDTNAVMPSPTEIQNRTYRDHGRYSVENQQLTFSLSNQQGQVDYWGQILKDKIVLNSHSHINGYRGTNAEYLFVEM